MISAAQSSDLPTEKLTPILKLSEMQHEDEQRAVYEKEQARRPKISLEQAVAAALPEQARKQQMASGTRSPMTKMRHETTLSTAPLPPPVPTKQEMDMASRHQLEQTA